MSLNDQFSFIEQLLNCFIEPALWLNNKQGHLINKITDTSENPSSSKEKHVPFKAFIFHVFKDFRWWLISLKQPPAFFCSCYPLPSCIMGFLGNKERRTQKVKCGKESRICIYTAATLSCIKSKKVQVFSELFLVVSQRLSCVHAGMRVSWEDLLLCFWRLLFFLHSKAWQMCVGCRKPGTQQQVMHFHWMPQPCYKSCEFWIINEWNLKGCVFSCCSVVLRALPLVEEASQWLKHTVRRQAGTLLRLKPEVHRCPVYVSTSFKAQTHNIAACYPSQPADRASRKVCF